MHRALLLQQPAAVIAAVATPAQPLLQGAIAAQAPFRLPGCLRHSCQHCNTVRRKRSGCVTCANFMLQPDPKQQLPCALAGTLQLQVPRRVVTQDRAAARAHLPLPLPCPEWCGGLRGRSASISAVLGTSTGTPGGTLPPRCSSYGTPSSLRKWLRYSCGLKVLCVMLLPTVTQPSLMLWSSPNSSSLRLKTCTARQQQQYHTMISDQSGWLLACTINGCRVGGSHSCASEVLLANTG